ncbi:MAG: hypothetical protein JST83_19065 [Bacteroidetes bacterium]|nr:hypothetical protein [Bacteroidota bacterium]
MNERKDHIITATSTLWRIVWSVAGTIFFVGIFGSWFGLTLSLIMLGITWYPVWSYAGPAAVTCLLFLGFLYFLESSDGHQTNSVKENASLSESDVSSRIYCNAEDIYHDYDLNEVAADNKYKDHLVEVSGYVLEIGKDINQMAYIELQASENSFFNVRCYLQADQMKEASYVTKGQRRTLLGYGNGFPMHSVQIRDCVFQ